MSDKLTEADASCAVMQAGERIDDLQLHGLRIIQKETGFRFGMDAVLLADYARVEGSDRAADFGTGTGIVPLLIAGREKGRHIDAFEIQPDMADMAARSVRLNGLDGIIAVHALPVERADEVIAAGSLDVITCNPPYGQPGTTLINPNDALAIARHQTSDGLKAWFTMAYKLLRGKGRFAMVYPATRMLEVMQLMDRCRITPKRFRLIYPKASKAANLVLIEGMKDAKPMLHPEPPLIVYQEDGEMTPELLRIYHITD